MNSPPLVSPEAAELLRVEWQGVLRMRQRMQGLMTATFAGGAFTAPALSAVVYNLPLLLAFDVLKQALATARRERLFTSKRAQLGDMMDDSRDALAWLDWNALREGVRRRNRVAHDGELLEGAECIQDIERIELQLRAWGI